MKLAVMPFVRGSLSDPDWVTELGRRMDATGGVESLWDFEHVAFPSRYESKYPYNESGRIPDGTLESDRPDPLQWLGHVAAVTSRILLGTGLMLLPLHNPLVLAKRLATLDQLSRGRLIAGFGIGWLAEEYDALAVPFSERGRRADEYLAIMERVWAPGSATFHGEYHDFDDLHVNPKPYRGGRVPVVIGGHSVAAMRRAARFGTGVFLLNQTLEEVSHFTDVLHREAATVGRSPGEFEVTVNAPATREECQRLADAGVTRLLLSLRADDLGMFQDRVDRYIEQTLPA